VQKLRTVILNLWTAIIGSRSANLQFKEVFSGELEGKRPLRLGYLSIDWRIDPKQERRGITPLEGEFEGVLKNRTRNCRSSWCILFFTLLSCCTIV
jgi:hypothetical protein